MDLKDKKARRILKETPLYQFRICQPDATHEALKESDLDVFIK